MEYSAPLAPRLVTAAVTYSTACALWRYSLGHGFFCVLYAYVTPPIKPAGMTTASWLCLLGQPRKREEYTDYCSGCSIQPGEKTVRAAVSARREAVCSYVVLLWLLLWRASQKRINMSAGPMASHVLFPAFQPLAHALPTLGSANSARSMNSKTTGTVNRMKSKTQGKKKMGLLPPKKGSQQMIWTCQKHRRYVEEDPLTK